MTMVYDMLRGMDLLLCAAVGVAILLILERCWQAGDDRRSWVRWVYRGLIVGFAALALQSALEVQSLVTSPGAARPEQRELDMLFFLGWHFKVLTEKMAWMLLIIGLWKRTRRLGYHGGGWADEERAP